LNRQDISQNLSKINDRSNNRIVAIEVYYIIDISDNRITAIEEEITDLSDNRIKNIEDAAEIANAITALQLLYEAGKWVSGKIKNGGWFGNIYLIK